MGRKTTYITHQAMDKLWECIATNEDGKTVSVAALDKGDTELFVLEKTKEALRKLELES